MCQTVRFLLDRVNILIKAHHHDFTFLGYQSLWQPAPGVWPHSAALSTYTTQPFLPALGTVRGSEQATSLVPSRGQQSSAAIAPKVGGAKPASTGGRLNNAAEFALTKVDELVNWARKVNSTYMYIEL